MYLGVVTGVLGVITRCFVSDDKVIGSDNKVFLE
jgi:hypothetical protein